ncbi:MAG: VOC family protein [Comamonadaceae bacterium]|nr:MAG: VOC family protein [Comamonadaceae bacterium]
MQAYLSFDGRCAEALEFYASCLGGRILNRMTWGESPDGDKMPPESKDKIMHATLEARGHQLMGSDMPPGYPFTGYGGFSISVQAKTVDEGRQLFDALAAGGKVTMPYAPTFWAAGFGMLEDRFGVGWMVNVDQPPATGG